MNQRGKQRKYRMEDMFSEPSETVRRATLFEERGRYSPTLMAT
jgi:hypothetical protein